MRNTFLFWSVGFALGFAVGVVGMILTLRNKQRAIRKCHREALIEHRVDCVLSDEEMDELERLERRYGVTFGPGVVILQQYRWLVRAGMSPEFTVAKEEK